MPNNPNYKNVECPECGGPMVSRTGKFGTFWGCKKYPACKGTRDSIGRSKRERDEARDEHESADPNGPHNFGR